MAAVATDRIYEGQGRPRTKKAEKTDRPSHYQFALWAYEDGKRYAVPVGGVRTDKRSEYPLISTAILNEGTGTETLIWLHFDLDFKRADKKWVRDGELDWPAIAATLATDAPIILQYLSHVVRSSGGRGLSLVLAISPLELIAETADVQKLAFRVQSMIIRVLNHHGMGADEGACGLKRLMPNMFRAERVVDQAEFVQAMIQKRRPRVLQNLFYALRFHVSLRERNKRDRSDILWPDRRVEKPLARLYTDILDEAGPWGSIQMTAAAFIKRYGLSKNTVYKLLCDPPSWLFVEAVSGEGFLLTIRPTRELTDRAYGILMEEPEARRMSFLNISMPEEVRKGERNQWLVSIILLCKWKGLSHRETRDLLDRTIKRVPGWQKSQSLTRDLGTVLRSLFHHRSSLKGKIPDLELPGWLLEAMHPTKPKQLSQTFYKKGSLRDLNPRLPQSDFDIAPGISAFASGDLRPEGSGAGQAPGQVIDVGIGLCSLGDAGQSENHPVVREAADKNPVPGPGTDTGNTFAYLSGSALGGAFSKALMKSSLPASEKARILTEVTSIAEPTVKDRVRREWLTKLVVPA